jgi:hypothetical protein
MKSIWPARRDSNRTQGIFQHTAALLIAGKPRATACLVGLISPWILPRAALAATGLDGSIPAWGWLSIGLSCVAMLVAVAALWIAYLNGDSREWHGKGLGR